MSATVRILRQPVLEIRDLGVAVVADGALRPAVRGVGFSVDRGETLAIVGESGSGKSLTALALMGLLPAGAVQTGSILLARRELSGLGEAEWTGVRGRRIALVSQNPMTALNPVRTIGEQLRETIRAHQPVTSAEADAIALRLLDRVRLPAPRRLLGDYPHELSGGMRQRVLITMAIVNRPDVLIADEPTTALDASVKATILDLIQDVQRDDGMAVILISHDLGAVASRADRVLVLYAGRMAEERTAGDLHRAARHPYTQALLNAAPRRRPPHGPRPRLADIAGTVPSLRDLPDTGCAFAPRCALTDDLCRGRSPPMAPSGPGASVACHHVEDIADAAQ